MTHEDKKLDFIENISTDTKYFFTNQKESLYKVLLVTKPQKHRSQKQESHKQNKESYTVTLIPNVSFQVSPLNFEKITPINLIKSAAKEQLYNELDKFVETAFSTGYSEIFLGTDEYYDEENQYISEITAGVPYVDYYPDSAKAIYTVETGKNQSLRYEVYETAIKVSKDQIKNNTFIYEDFYTLWYPNQETSEQAMSSVLEVKETKPYTFESFASEVKKIDEHEEIRPNPEGIIFEHLVKTESYLSEDISELKLPIPQSNFKPFDETDIEEGRLYFWIKKNEESVSKSKINYFVLQNRKINGYVIGSCKLGGFRSHYRDNSVMTYSMSDEIQHLINRVSKGFVEISQVEIIEIFTAKKTSEIFAQTIDNSVYIDQHVYDLYENMVQHWAEGPDKEDFTYHTLFFESKEKRDSWFKEELTKQKSYDLDVSSKKERSALLQHYKSVDALNKKYKEQKFEKEALLKQHPGLKEKFSDKNYKSFMKYSPLKVIEGNLVVDESLRLNADETSLFITGDLIVNGTLMAETETFFQSNTFLIVAGNVRVDNYVQNKGFALILFAQDFLVNNFTYLPAASRSWFIEVAGNLQTDVLIHAKDHSVKGLDEKMIFNHEYSTTNKNVFVDGVLNEKNRVDEDSLFNLLKQDKSLLKDNLNQDQIDDDLLLTAFKGYLRNWHSLYYNFAGFELQELEFGEHYGHYIESDQIVEDKRHGTGMYLMSHDDYSLELVKADKPLKEDHISSKDLAYRFFWIMWTFSNWKHRSDGPIDYWKNVEAVDTRYNAGKPYFKGDPHLALYWIMHFGLLEDARFEEIQSLMKDSDHPLIKGALLFFAELQKTESYPIKIDNKNNTTLFNQRIIHHKEQIKKAMVPEDDQVEYTMTQFEKQPDRVLEFINDLHKNKEWDKVNDYLNNNPYQPGFSFLRILTTKENDKSKWQSLFVKEAEMNKNTWKKSYLLVPMFDMFYEDLGYEDLNTAISIVLERASNISNEKIYVKMAQRLQQMPKPENSETTFEDRLEGCTKDNFDFQTFINKSSDIEAVDKILFIRACIAKDLFSEEFKQTTVTPYLLVWYMADKDFYDIDQGQKQIQIEEVIMHYNLSEADFHEKYKTLAENERISFFLAIKQYFKA
ncbi:hypothetical protein GCM10009133_15400 [Cocleimonas flava]|uniref:Uncharacterized protein n=1 Tax=Cocleimonas flava TaxID=634765 RepID=A0A4R1EZ13_9GAMM|nr:hypothetical protein [Cocleimonas flava]TCJ84468.1 hypothetical protein EV695_2425 [Cocleimonas flava]